MYIKIGIIIVASFLASCSMNPTSQYKYEDGSIASASKAAGTSSISSSSQVKYKCSELSSEQANQLFSSGHSYLDGDNDGIPCEKKPYYSRPAATKTYSRSGSNCHWVSGYRRKDGTYVKGHQRCR